MRKRRFFTGFNVEVAGQTFVAVPPKYPKPHVRIASSLLTWLSAPPVEPRPNSMDDPRSSPS
jgi:hypothetical protein